MPISSPSELANVVAWWDASTGNTLTKDGSETISAWANSNSPGTYDLTVTGSDATKKYYWDPVGINGKGCVRKQVDQQYVILFRCNPTPTGATEYLDEVNYYYIGKTTNNALEGPSVRVIGTGGNSLNYIGPYSTNQTILQSRSGGTLNQHIVVTNQQNGAVYIWAAKFVASTSQLTFRVYDAATGDEVFNNSYVGSPISGQLAFPDYHVLLEDNVASDDLYFGASIVAGVMSEQEHSDAVLWFRTTFGYVSQRPHNGLHEVTDTSQANDPNCIYFDQNVQIGDQFSYKQQTETNGWGVDIDAQGYPIVDSGGATGTDSFIFTISRDGGSTWEPDSTWTFTIGDQPPVGDPGEGTGLGLNLSLRI